MYAIPLQPHRGSLRAAHHPFGSSRRALCRAAATVREWRRRARDRAALAAYDERLLRDIGLTPGEAEVIVNKPFWRE